VSKKIIQASTRYFSGKGGNDTATITQFSKYQNRSMDLYFDIFGAELDAETDNQKTARGIIGLGTVAIAFRCASGPVGGVLYSLIGGLTVRLITDSEDENQHGSKKSETSDEVPNQSFTGPITGPRTIRQIESNMEGENKRRSVDHSAGTPIREL
jgi:hypothetical protein